MNDLFANDARKAAQAIREGQVTALYSCWGWIYLCDAASNPAMLKLFEVTSQSEIAGQALIIDDTGKLNKYLKAVPEFADDLMSFSEKPMIAWFENALNVSAGIKDASGAAPFMLAHDELLAQAAVRSGKSVFVRIPAHGSPASETVLKSVDCIIPLQRRRIEPFTPAVIRFRSDGSFHIEKNRPA